MKKKIVMIALAVVILAALVLTHIPKRIESTLTVCTGAGETAEIDFDILYYPNLILPSYVKGMLSFDGVTYIDAYTKHKEFPNLSGNRLFSNDWWKTTSSLPHNMTFVRSDCTDIISTAINRIDVLDIVFNKGEIVKIHCMYADESNQIGTTISGISYWGPAENAEEAEKIAQSFGYKSTGNAAP